MKTISMRTRQAYAPHFKLELGKPQEICIVEGCTRKTKTKHSLCYCHGMRLWRKQNPESAQYARLKAEAKKRRKIFAITREEWAALCRLTRYHEGTASLVGSVANGLTIDRINPRGGYTLDNVRVIVNHLNSQKGAYEMKCRLHTGVYVMFQRDARSVADELKTDPETELEKLIERI